MTVLLLFIIGLPVALLLGVVWVIVLVAQADQREDTIGRGDDPKARSLAGRLRTWLTAPPPKKLDYRRDKRGRFRRVRRG